MSRKPYRLMRENLQRRQLQRIKSSRVCLNSKGTGRLTNALCYLMMCLLPRAALVKNEKSRLSTDIVIDVASRVDSPDRAISTCANIGKATGDLDPRVVIIACVAIDVASRVDSPDIGSRSNRDPSESTGDLLPFSHERLLSARMVFYLLHELY